MNWIKGIPTVEQVAAHESLHPHPNMNRVEPVGVTYPDRAVRMDSPIWGDWICYYPLNEVESSNVFWSKLKVIAGEVYVAVGRDKWSRLDEHGWASYRQFFPVGHDGLPLDYERTK